MREKFRREILLWLSEEETKSKNEQEDDPEEEEDATANRICASLSSTKNNFKIVFVVFRGTTTHVSRIYVVIERFGVAYCIQFY